MFSGKQVSVRSGEIQAILYEVIEVLKFCPKKPISLHVIMEDRCLGYPEASTVIRELPDGLLHWQQISATHPGALYAMT